MELVHKSLLPLDYDMSQFNPINVEGNNSKTGAHPASYPKSTGSKAAGA